MPIFQYLTFKCSQPELQDRLAKAGLEGWRLHTCDAIPTIGQYGSGIPEILVVLDRIADEPEEQYVLEDGASEGIAMTG
jgi:hypothetical protein